MKLPPTGNALIQAKNSIQYFHGAHGVAKNKTVNFSPSQPLGLLPILSSSQATACLNVIKVCFKRLPLFSIDIVNP